MRLTHLIVPSGDVESAGARLWGAGATAIEERTTDADRVVLVTVLAADDELSRRRFGNVPDTWELLFVDDETEASDAWREHARPIVVNADLEIRPAWVPAVPSTPRTVVAIEPAGAFGLGDHPTTRLSADAAWRLTSPGDRVLDVGSGSGVLAIVAVARGASSAVAIDVAEAAREATLDNARRNDVADLIDASTTPIGELTGTFDVVFANILAPVLISMADELTELTAPGGRLVVSGVLADAHDHVLAALVDFDVVDTRELAGWACVELIRCARR